jgi:hypothetical protein
VPSQHLFSRQGSCCSKGRGGDGGDGGGDGGDATPIRERTTAVAVWYC